METTDHKTPKVTLNQHAPNWTHYFGRVGNLLCWIASLFIYLPCQNLPYLLSYPLALSMAKYHWFYLCSLLCVHHLLSIPTTTVSIRPSSPLHGIVAASWLVSPILPPPNHSPLCFQSNLCARKILLCQIVPFWRKHQPQSMETRPHVICQPLQSLFP